MAIQRQAPPSSYFTNAESAVEASRLIRQDQLYTRRIGLLPPGVDGQELKSVLDLGCGPGGWLLDLAAAYPITGVGVDISPTMIMIANQLRDAEKESNPNVESITFVEADARGPLPFPSGHFNYVQIRLGLSWLWKPLWEGALRECYRVLTPGGILFISDLELSLSNKPTIEQAHAIPPVAYAPTGALFTPTGRSMGLLTGLPPLIKRVGFVEQHISLHHLDSSRDSPDYELLLELMRIIHLDMKAFLEQNGYPDVQALHEKAMIEWQEEDFVGISVHFSNWSRKPLNG